MTARVAIPALAVACAITAIVASNSLVDAGATSYAGASGAAEAADILAGLGLVLSGALAWTQARTRTLGLLAMLAGLAWLGPDWEGWAGAPSVARSLGAAISPLFLALLFHLALTLPTGRIKANSARFVVAGVYVLAGAISVGGALFGDPFLDPYCWRNCSDSAFLVHADPGLASALGDVWTRSALVVGAGATVIAAARLMKATAPARRVLMPTLVPVALAGVAEIAYAVALLRDPLEDPDETGFAAIFFARSFSALALALGIAWSILNMRRIRSSVSRLAVELAEAPPAGRLRDGLVAALGDPGLDVRYWLADSGRYVTADGAAA